MVHVPAPVQRLCVSMEFDIAASDTNKRPSTEQHVAAVQKAAQVLDDTIAFSQHGVTATAFSAKVVDGNTLLQDSPDNNNNPPLTLSMAHNSSFDPSFHMAKGGPAIRYEFIYYDPPGSATSKLFLRIVTTFGKPEETIDGVLATRLGLTAMELLEGNDAHPAIFPQLPPFQMGARNVGKFLYHMVLRGLIIVPFAYLLMYLNLLLERIGFKSKPKDLTRVNNVVSMLRFYSDPKHKSDRAEYNVYRSEGKSAFKTFMATAEKWTKSLGLDGYFYMVNFSPFTSPGICYNVSDMSTVAGRYRNMCVPPGPPPGEDIWFMLNNTTSNKLIINNYGNHRHNFAAKPVAFLWDWLHLRSTAHAAVCISVNGVFMGAYRGVKSSLAQISIPKETFPNPPVVVHANGDWTNTMIQSAT